MVERSLVLDTHVWLWSVAGDSALKSSARQLISTALRKSLVMVPAISVWEIGMLWQRGRIQLSQPVSEWVRGAIEKSGFTLLPLDAAIALESTMLPGTLHSDPADCMIVASARLHNALLLTRDAKIIKYGNLGHVDTVTV